MENENAHLNETEERSRQDSSLVSACRNIQTRFNTQTLPKCLVANTANTMLVCTRFLKCSVKQVAHAQWKNKEQEEMGTLVKLNYFIFGRNGMKLWHETNGRNGMKLSAY
jgi:hypothetical protein